MDFARDAFLMSHMGEGNWALARARPAGAADQAHPRDRRARRSADLPLPVRAGPVHARVALASRTSRFRLVVSEGEILDTDELPGLEMPYGFFRPATGVEECANGWLRAGGPITRS